MALEGLIRAGGAGLLDVVEWVCAKGEEIAGIELRKLVSERRFWAGSLMDEAATKNNVPLMRWLVDHGVAVDKVDNTGETAFHTAARAGSASIVKLLLDNGVPVDGKTEKGQTALHFAATNRDLTTAQLLLTSGAHVNEKDARGQTALHLASSVAKGNAAMTQLLVDNGALSFAEDEQGHTALSCSIRSNNFELVQFFLTQCFSDEKPPDRDLWNALFAAARHDQSGTIEHLVKELGVEVSVVSRQGRTALHEAIASGSLRSVESLLGQGADGSKPDNFGTTPVMEACRHCDLDVLHVLMEHGGNVKDTDITGRTALHYAAEGGPNIEGYSTFLRSLVGYDAVVFMLLEHGADINCVDKRGWTPVHYAAANNRVKAVKELISGGANLAVETISGKTAVILALERRWSEIVRLLTSAELPDTTSDTTSALNVTALVDYDEYLLDPMDIRVDSSVEGFWLDSPIEVKEVEGWNICTFAEELGQWSRLNHPHVVKLYGVYCGDRTREPFFVYERVDLPLLSYLEEFEAELWDKLYEAALGLQYLHDRNVVHGDISCYSIAIGANGDAKIWNFGRDNVPASHRYLRSLTAAPEVVSGLPSTFEADVFAFGITILQVVWRTSDLWGLSDEARNRVILSGLLPEKPVKMSSAQWQLVTRMCCLDPEDRLSAADVVRQLEVFTSKHRMANCGAVELDCGPLSWLNLGLEHADNSTVLLEITEMCAGSAMIDLMNRQVYDRLADVSNELRGTSDDQLELILQFSSILRYYHKRLQSTRSVGKAEGACFAASRSGADDTYSVHRELDSFMDTALLSRSSKVHQWRDKWNQLRNQQQHEIMEKLTDFPTLFEDIDDAREREEVLTYLRFELSKYPSCYVMSSASKFTQAKSVISSLANFKNANWFIPQYEVEFDKFNEFSSGSFGSVHRGQWKHAQVVVKKLKLLGSDDAASSFGDTFEVEPKEVMDVGLREEIEATFLNEVEIWHKLFHPHVVQLFGACHVGQPFFVCEYASGGQLDDYLSQHPNEVWSKLHEAALGLRYLHSKHIIHADLKCNNILIGRDGYAKLTDFGLSEFDTNHSVRSEAEEDGSQHVNIGAIRWKAPEVLRGEKNTFESDIYSFGMCILEAVSGDYPWGRVLDPVVKYYVLQERRIPRRPTKCSEEAYDLVQRMCRYAPNERLGIKEVADALKSL